VRFFHEAYFDHVFALQHVQGGRTAADLLRDDPQGLIRRGQVRAILTLERQQDWTSYVADLRAVLGRDSVRSHLRAAVLTWLTDLGTVEEDEIRVVLEIATDSQDALRRNAIRVLSSEPFVRALHARGLLPAVAANLGATTPPTDSLLAGLIARIDAERCAYLLFEAARSLPEAFHEVPAWRTTIGTAVVDRRSGTGLCHYGLDRIHDAIGVHRQPRGQTLLEPWPARVPQRQSGRPTLSAEEERPPRRYGRLPDRAKEKSTVGRPLTAGPPKRGQ
jgi:hypothetical protein